MVKKKKVYDSNQKGKKISDLGIALRRNVQDILKRKNTLGHKKTCRDRETHVDPTCSRQDSTARFPRAHRCIKTQYWWQFFPTLISSFSSLTTKAPKWYFFFREPDKLFLEYMWMKKMCVKWQSNDCIREEERSHTYPKTNYNAIVKNKDKIKVSR